MKRKIFSTLFALVLALSLSLVSAVAMGQEASNYAGVVLGLQDCGTGGISSTAQWVEDSTLSGNYAVELDTVDSDGDASVDAARVVLPYNQPLSTITELGYSYKLLDREGNRPNCDSAPYMVLELDTDETPGADTWVVHHMFTTGNLNEWTTWALSDDPLENAKMASGAIVGETAYMWHVEGAQESKALFTDALHVQWEDVTAELGTATMLRVQVAVGQWTSDKREAHNIDDVTINDTTYDLEPMVLDAVYYSIGEAVTVTLTQGNKNLDPMTLDTVDITVVSDTDTTGDTVTLTETGSDTGVFTGPITLLGAPPANRTNDEIVVSAEDTVTVTYAAADWGAGTESAFVLTATVDDTAPVITVVSPAAGANITDTTPLIRANYSDAGSGIDITTDVMTLDGSPVTPATSTTTEITYTPSALLDGSHTVTVDVSDKAGNAATQLSWSFTVDTVNPVIAAGQAADPPVILPNISSNITFTATVADLTSGVASVIINLSPVDGTVALAMLDADADGIYTASENITESTEGDYNLTVTATDFAGNSDTADITLGVWEDIVDPVITSPAITYPFVGVDSAMPGASVIISANVTDAGGMGTVTAACAEFNATINLLDNGSAPDTDADDNIYTGTATVASDATAGAYTITITATDAKGNDATNVSLSLTVDPAATGYDITLSEGWNLISLPLIPTDGSIDVVLADISDNVSQVRTFVYVDGVLTEKFWMEGGAVGLLDEMVDGQGYWIEMTEAKTLTVQGSEQPGPGEYMPEYDIYEGWNLIGFKSLSDTTAAQDYLGGAVTLIFERMYGYDAAGGIYTPIQLATPDLEPGQGYWLAVSAAGTIYP